MGYIILLLAVDAANSKVKGRGRVRLGMFFFWVSKKKRWGKSWISELKRSLVIILDVSESWGALLCVFRHPKCEIGIFGVLTGGIRASQAKIGQNPAKNDLPSFRRRFGARRELVWSTHWYFVIPDSKERHHDILSACGQPCNKFCGRNLLHGDRKLLHRGWCHHMTRFQLEIDTKQIPIPHWCVLHPPHNLRWLFLHLWSPAM